MWKPGVITHSDLSLISIFFYLSAGRFNIRHEEVKEKDGHKDGHKEHQSVCLLFAVHILCISQSCLICLTTAPATLPPPSLMPMLLGFECVSLVDL